MSIVFLLDGMEKSKIAHLEIIAPLSAHLSANSELIDS